jgi:hypothetical protein
MGELPLRSAEVPSINGSVDAAGGYALGDAMFSFRRGITFV